jgi:hypothetical protein
VREATLGGRVSPTDKDPSLYLRQPENLDSRFRENDENQVQQRHARAGGQPGVGFWDDLKAKTTDGGTEAAWRASVGPVTIPERCDGGPQTGTAAC